MPASTERPKQAALIPWVIALVALIALNSISQDYSRARKIASTGKAAISQPADVLTAPGTFSSLLVFLIPHSTYRAAIVVSRVLDIEVFREDPPSASPQGAIHGRAPPTGLLA